jgi:tyrosyl-tRNA synthetase
MAKYGLEGDGMNIVDLLVNSGFLKSKGEARRAIAEGGIYLNNQRVSDLGQQVTLNYLLDGRFVVLRRGKKNYHLLKVNG